MNMNEVEVNWERVFQSPVWDSGRQDDKFVLCCRVGLGPGGFREDWHQLRGPTLNPKPAPDIQVGFGTPGEFSNRFLEPRCGEERWRGGKVAGGYTVPKAYIYRYPHVHSLSLSLSLLSYYAIINCDLLCITSH